MMYGSSRGNKQMLLRLGAHPGADFLGMQAAVETSTVATDGQGQQPQRHRYLWLADCRSQGSLQGRAMAGCAGPSLVDQDPLLWWRKRFSTRWSMKRSCIHSVKIAREG